MLGIESMLAGMLGLTQEEMKNTIGNAVNLLASLDARLTNIETKVVELHAIEFPSQAVIDLIGATPHD